MDEDPERGVDRHTSVRSVMTLPSYSAAPREGEGVLGREGERAGMDTVVELPEDADEEEARRDEEMESLYQIRLRRREEIAAREERRRLRREARARGDQDALAALRQESLQSASERERNGSAALIADHQARPRDRRVSAVSYGDLGVARHDGSRVRANSNESDSRPLLDAAGALGMSEPFRPWLSRESLGTHHRGRSASSVVSMSSFDSEDQAGRDGSSDFEIVSLQQTQTNSRSQSRTRSRANSYNRPRNVSGIRSRAASSAEPLPPLDADLADIPIPGPDPPQYDTMGFEEAPPYESPVRDRAQQAQPIPSIEVQPAISAPQLPVIERLPSLRITEATPVEPRRHEFPVLSDRNATREDAEAEERS